MTNPLNLCEVIEYVKNIVDSIRCTVCDKAGGARVRYSCGHATCDDCLTVDEGCMLCLTPPSTLTKPQSDKPYSQRVENACSLLNACQDTFNLDVYRRLRVSEQLKAEKELFPECIQAPVKYTNKRKSLVSTSNKENLGHTFYPGERISQSNSFKMNKCNNYVQQWLNNSGNKTRKALSVLKINNENIMDSNIFTKNKRNKINTVKEKEEIITGSNRRKRSHSNNSYSLLDTHIKSNKSQKKMKSQHLATSKDELKPTLCKNENDESGIVLDDEPILIEDSQSQVLDKDALALLAVEAAHYENADVTTVSLENTQGGNFSPNCDDSGIVRQEFKCKSVPFVRKSSLLHYCSNCKKNDGTNTTDNAKNISITIENDCFVTTINVSNLTDVGHDKNSVHVQTDISEIPFGNKDVAIENNLVSISEKRGVETERASSAYESQLKQDVNDREVQSPNIFETFEDVPNKKRHIVIDDSDSDVSNLEVNVVHVTADIHRSCEPLDYGILGEMKANELVNRSRKKVRGATPDSNNSSDKENCDPNKRRKHKHVKKIKCFKK